MELKKLELKKLELEEDKHFLNSKINLLRDKLGIHGINYQGDRVQGGKRTNAQEDLILQISDMERDVEFIEKEIDVLSEHLTNLENIAKQYGDEYTKIIELKSKGAKIVGIASEMNMSDRTVKRRLDKMGLTQKRK